MMPKRTNLLTIILILALGVTAYVWYSYLQSNPRQNISSSVKVGATDQQFLILLERLKTIQFDLTLFDDPLFENLQSAGPPLELPLPKPRVNPFAPF